jgi:hypothetical protein
MQPQLLKRSLARPIQLGSAGVLKFGQTYDWECRQKTSSSCISGLGGFQKQPSRQHTLLGHINSHMQELDHSKCG